jgi:hypothetical protein
MKDEGWRSRLIDKPRWHVGVEQRYCHVHPATRAVDRCDRCGEPYCAACLREVERWRVCTACCRLFLREERAVRLPERLRRWWGQVLVFVSIVAVLALITLGMQALLRGASSNAAMLQSAEIVGNRLNGAAAPRTATLHVEGTLAADHPPATLVITGSGFLAGEVVTVKAELDGSGALLGPTNRGQEGVTPLGQATAKADNDGAISVWIAVHDAAHSPTLYRLQVYARGNRGTAAALDLHPAGP